MRSSLAPHSFVLALAFVVAGCDGEPTRIIVEGEGEEGEGEEGEGEGGEGEGDDGVVVGECAALRDAVFGEAIALVTPRSRHTAALLQDGRVMLIGGEDDTFGQIADVEIIDLEAGVSVAGPPLLTARYEHASVVLKNGDVVVAGGFGPGGHLSSVEVFDGVDWKDVGNLDAARAGLSGFLAFDKAIFFGGDNATTIPTTVVSVDETSILTVLDVDIGENRRLHAAAQRADGSIVVAGGFFTSPIVTVNSFDLTNTVIEERLPTARRQAGAGSIAAGVVVVGGLGVGEFLRDIQVLDGTGWTETSRLRTARASPEVAAIAGCLAVCGGIGVDPTAPVSLASCEGVDAAGHTVEVVDLPTATFSFTLTSLDDGGALFAGGSLGENHVAEARVLR